VANTQEQLEQSASPRYSNEADRRANPVVMPRAPSRVDAIVFRLRLSIALVSIPFALGFVGPYLYFDVLTRTIGRWCGVVEYAAQIAMLAIGSTVLSMAFVGSADQASLGRTVFGTGGIAFLRFVIGYATVVGVIALMLIAIDSRLDRAAVQRRTTQYLRFSVATIMLVYAIAKVVPTQFGFLTPADLLAPYGSRNGFWVLWDFMAASTGYTIFCGLSELTGSLLLCFRRTSLLGGLVIAGVMLNVLALNVAYNIVAVGAATMILVMDLALIGPALPAAIRFTLGARGEALELPDALVRAPRRRQWAFVKLAVLALMLAVLVSSGVAQLRTYHGAGQPWFGAYDVASFDGGSALPDSLRWVRVASDGRYGKAGGFGVRIQTADDRWHHYSSQIDAPARELVLMPFDGRSASYRVRYAMDSAGLTLSTSIAGDSVTARLRPIDLHQYQIFRAW
jgi:hypothetical protein